MGIEAHQIGFEAKREMKGREQEKRYLGQSTISKKEEEIEKSNNL